MNFCTNCGKENGPNSKFCRFCGNPLKQNTGHGAFAFHVRIPENLSRRTVLTWVAVVMTLAILAVAAPKASAYFAVQKVLGEISSYESASDYQKAIDALASTDKLWTTSSTRNKISDLKTKEAQYLKWQQDYNTAIVDIKNKNYEHAETLLRAITSIYPQYNDVQTKLNEVQTDIEGNLNAQVNSANAAAAAAARAKAAADAARMRAEADANAAAADAAATQTVEVEKSFLGQLSSIFKDYSSGVAYFNQGLSYLGSGSDSVAIVAFGQANAVFARAQQNAEGMDSTFTNMPQAYVNAATNMSWAAYYMTAATNSAIDQVGNTYDTSTATNSDSATATSYDTQVRAFLNSQGY